MLVPSIDLLDGCVVQLEGGDPDRCRVRLEDPLAVAARWARYGELAVIDLDAALGRGDNIEVVEAITSRFAARVGGGIRDHKRADRLLRAGATKLIIGTRATPEFLGHYPPERIIVAVDARRGQVVTNGWLKGTDDTPEARAKALQPYCSEFLYTLVDREGAMGGTDLDAVGRLVAATSNHVVAAGGITTVEEIVALDQMGASCQLGMAMYTGVLDLDDAYMSLLDWQKNEGLLPVITQDRHGQVLMHAWTDPAGLRETLRGGVATYYSRSRRARWQKGETSGHTQPVDTVRYDCDHDTLLYTVKQTGRACHVPGKYSCFGDAAFGLSQLEETVWQRRASADEGSYTSKLLANPDFLHAKLREEVEELCGATSDREVVWEAADVLYFTMVKLASRGLTLAQVEKELHGRHGRRRPPTDKDRKLAAGGDDA